MDQQHLFHPQTQNKHSNKKRLTHEQVKLLERSFTANKRLEPERKVQLARELGVPARQVAIWYQNKRARWRTQSLEYDYGALQVRLESVEADKRRVEQEVERLKGELRRAQEMVLAADTNTNKACSTMSTNNSCGDDEGDWRRRSHGGEGLQFDELYACFVDADDDINGASRWG